jgi:hypothetical protein
MAQKLLKLAFEKFAALGSARMAGRKVKGQGTKP